jgi:transcriptional regulator with XRE-family HTH domain
MCQSAILELVGRRLREERTRCRLSLEAAADELGVHKSVLSRIENGERGLDSVLLRQAAGLYEVPMDTLFEEVDTGLVVKARDVSGDIPGVEEMGRWAQRKLSELRFVREERTGA